MIGRFIKKLAASKTPPKPAAKETKSVPKKDPPTPKEPPKSRTLTAEGWKRLMMKNKKNTPKNG